MKKFWLYWRWYAFPLASIAGAVLALMADVGARTAFDYARTLENPTPRAVARLPILQRTMMTLYGAAVNVALRAPVELHAEIPTLELVVDPEEFSLLGTRNAKSTGLEVDGNVKIGDRWTKAKVRLRGDNIFHWGAELRSYTLELGRGAAVRGQQQINLINPKDATALSIPFGEQTARRLGLFTPDTQPCRLMLNGENQGVYFCQQPTNDAWLRLAHKPAGAVYIGDFLIYGYGSNFAGARQLWDTPSLWEASTAEAEQPAERAALDELLGVWHEIVRAPASAAAAPLARRLDQVSDVDGFLRLWATQTWTESNHQDEYHNWRLYLDPSDGRFRPIVWDTLRAWDANPAAALDGPLPRPQMAILRFPELNQRRFAILYDELVKPELAKGVSAAWARDYGARTRMTMLSAASIDRMDWTPGALSWVHVSRIAALREQETALKRINAHARALAALLDAVDVADPACAPEGGLLRCSLVLKSRAAVEPVALVAAGGRKRLMAQAVAGGAVRLRPGEGSPARFYPQFVTAAGDLPGRYHAHIAGVAQTFVLEGAAPGGEVRLVWRNTLTGREVELGFPVRSALPAAPQTAAYNFAAQPIPQAPPAIRLGPGAVTLTKSLETEPGQSLEFTPGTRVRLGPGVSIFARGHLLVRGTARAPVVFERLEPKLAWGGIAILGHGGADSRIEGCRIDGGSVPRRASYSGTGMLHIAHAERVLIADCTLTGSTGGDDALALSQTADVHLRDVAVNHAERDCVDLDHATGRIERLTAASCGNDALDMADSIVEVRGSVLGPARDKAVSAGEYSAIWLAGSTLQGADVALLVKDVAQAYLDPGVRFAANRLDVFGYRRAKSSERGGCVLSAVAADLNANLEDDSRLTRVDTLRDLATTWTKPGMEGPCWRR